MLSTVSSTASTPRFPVWMRGLIFAVSVLLAAVVAAVVWDTSAAVGFWRWPLAALGLVVVAGGLPVLITALAVLARPRAGS